MNPTIKLTDFGVYVMHEDSHLSRWVEQDGRLDHARGYIEKFAHKIPEGGTVIDCGTSIGDHTITYAQKVGPNGVVLGFEANSDVAECCRLNMEPFPWVKIFNLGLSHERGEAGMDFMENVGASSINTSKKGVKLVPLDDFIPYLNKRCDFIKVDVEGFEPKLLAGGAKLIYDLKPAILMEVNEGALKKQGFKPQDIFSTLRKLRYKWKVVDGVLGSPQYDILATSLKK
jgi:FkbM family methyltransferase